MALAGETAMELWRKGHLKWNSWVEQTKVHDVDFSGMDFCSERGPGGTDPIDFSGFVFPDGFVSFDGAKFGNGDVSFNNADFGEGEVSFSGTEFGIGNVSFRRTKFGKERVNFEDAKFVSGTVSFNDVSFEKGIVSFKRVSFGDSDVTFKNVNFGGGASFMDAVFGDGDVSFSRAKFGVGDASFERADFGNGDINFIGSDFAGDFVSFHYSSFGAGDVDFENAVFAGDLDFANASKTEKVTKFSFRYASFDKNFSLPNTGFNCVLDLRNTKISNQITLHNLCYELLRGKRSWQNFFQKVALDPEDASRLRRLKELAEANRDHEKALELHADEMRAKRWHEFGKLASLLDLSFSLLSDYGQSIWKPTVALFSTVALLIIFHTKNSDGKLLHAAEYTIANSLPFLTSARGVREKSLAVLYCENPPEFLNMLTFTQGIATVIFLFLIGLGLRNRFRI